MKVKKFRIKPRIPTVGRILKGKLNIKTLPEELTQRLEETSQKFLDQITPAGFYQTWHGEKVPGNLSQILDRSVERKSVAITLLVATIGPEPEQILSEPLMEGDITQSHVVTAFCEEGLDLSFRFIQKLLTEDAQSDDCEITPPIELNESEFLPEALELVGASSEGVELDSAEHLNPRFTRVALVAWLPIKKKSRTGSLSRKKFA